MRMTGPSDTRASHLAWARNRALGYVACGDYAGAIASLISDLNTYTGTDAWSGRELTELGTRGIALVLGSYDRRQLIAWLDSLR